MFSYQIKNETVIRSDGAFIPCARENMDFQRFLLDWEAGVSVTEDDVTVAFDAGRFS